jgi:hypothetical protein
LGGRRELENLSFEVRLGEDGTNDLLSVSAFHDRPSWTIFFRATLNFTSLPAHPAACRSPRCADRNKQGGDGFGET